MDTLRKTFSDRDLRRFQKDIEEDYAILCGHFLPDYKLEYKSDYKSDYKPYLCQTLSQTLYKTLCQSLSHL